MNPPAAAELPQPGIWLQCDPPGQLAVLLEAAEEGDVSHPLEPLVDASSRSTFIARLADLSSDPAVAKMLEDYATANVAASDRRPIDEALGKIRWRAQSRPRIASETSAWLKAHAR